MRIHSLMRSSPLILIMSHLVIDIIDGQVHILSPPNLIRDITALHDPTNHGDVTGSTAAFATPYYGERKIGRYHQTGYAVEHLFSIYKSSIIIIHHYQFFVEKTVKFRNDVSLDYFQLLTTKKGLYRKSDNFAYAPCRCFFWLVFIGSINIYWSKHHQNHHWFFQFSLEYWRQCLKWAHWTRDLATPAVTNTPTKSCFTHYIRPNALQGCPSSSSFDYSSPLILLYHHLMITDTILNIVSQSEWSIVLYYYL